MEHAIKHKRNIIPLTFDDVDFLELRDKLPSELAKSMSRYQGIRVLYDYFDEAMEKLRKRFLSKPVNAILHPPNLLTRIVVGRQQDEILSSQTIPKESIEALRYFEQGFRHANNGNHEQAIVFYTEVVKLMPNSNMAYNNRGNSLLN